MWATENVVVIRFDFQFYLKVFVNEYHSALSIFSIFGGLVSFLWFTIYLASPFAILYFFFCLADIIKERMAK